MSSARAADTLRGILRFFGTTSLLALIFVAAPRSWMSSIHAGLGMGAMPDAPVVWYLARSTSAFYALLGGLFWLLASDPARHRSVLVYLGSVLAILGLALVAIDWAEGLPLLWKVWEGPVVIGLGLAIRTLSGKLPETDRETR